jgi:hypothetical protein
MRRPFTVPGRKCQASKSDPLIVCRKGCFRFQEAGLLRDGSVGGPAQAPPAWIVRAIGGWATAVAKSLAMRGSTPRRRFVARASHLESEKEQ